MNFMLFYGYCKGDSRLRPDSPATSQPPSPIQENSAERRDLSNAEVKETFDGISTCLNIMLNRLEKVEGKLCQSSINTPSSSDATPHRTKASVPLAVRVSETPSPSFPQH